MKTLPTFAMLVMAAFVSSCQKDNQTSSPAPKLSAADAPLNTLATTSATSTICHDVNLGMIAFYPFHGNAHDESGHGHDGFVYSYDSDGVYPGAVPAVLTTNKYGKANEAYLFNGTTDEILTTVFDPNKVVTQFSLYARYKSTETVQGVLVASGDGLSGWAFALTVDSPNDFGFGWVYTDDSFQRQVNEGVGGSQIALGKNCWVDVVVNYSNKVLTLYVNGKLVGTRVTNMALPPHFAKDLTIASSTFRYPTGFFNSAIDEVRVYNRPLTTDEISYLLGH